MCHTLLSENSSFRSLLVVYTVLMSLTGWAVLRMREKSNGHLGCMLSGCKENHFYSLPFGQAEASIY